MLKVIYMNIAIIYIGINLLATLLEHTVIFKVANLSSHHLHHHKSQPSPDPQSWLPLPAVFHCKAMVPLLIATEHLQHRKSPTTVFMNSLILFTLSFRSPPALMTVVSMKNPLRCLLLAQLLVLSTVVVISVRAQTDGCGLDLTSFLPAPYSDSASQICKPVWNSFILRVSQQPL